MKIVVSGSTGFVGQALCSYLRERGHSVTTLVRQRRADPSATLWNPAQGELDPAALDGADAIIHLAGANVAEGRWSDQRKQEILQSRVDGLRTLATAWCSAVKRPPIIISASATGYYGDRREELLDETSAAGTGFLAEVCQEWEAGLVPFAEAGARTVALRFGLVLGPGGGALGKMLPVFKLGLGGCLGDGRQWMSWIARDDLLAVIAFTLNDERAIGAINTVAPEPVRNAEFTRVLARVLRRPAMLPVPKFVLRGVFGEMANETLLASARVDARRLREWGFAFRFPSLEPALRELG